MPPKKEPCRNFQRGSCQYGDRCKFLHVNQQQSKPNPFGFGMQSGNQFQRTNLQQPNSNPFGFGVQNNAQSRMPNGKQNQFKPFENKWTRPSNSSNSTPRQPENQSVAPNHKCTDPETCKRQIIEDFQNERPMWKLTCYGHNKNGTCDILGDVSYEELRAAAYDDAKRGVDLQSIVERERNLLNSKLAEFESLVRNPYAVPQSSGVVAQSSFGFSNPNAKGSAQNSPPVASSFGQLFASPNGGFGISPTATQGSLFGQPNAFQNAAQTSSGFSMANSSFGSFGSQQPQSLQSPFTPSLASFNNTAATANQNSFPASTFSSNVAAKESIPFNGPSSTSSSFGQTTASSHLMNNLTRDNGRADDSIWMKKEWKIGEIPEEAPPDNYVF